MSGLRGPAARLTRALFAFVLLPIGFARGAQCEDIAIAEPAPLHFRVVIDAPRPYEKMFESGLDLMRWQKGERVTMPLLERLVAEARTEVADTLAAGGYFKPTIDTRIDSAAPAEAVVHMKVAPGPRTRVRNLDLAVDGPASQDAEGRRRIAAIREGWTLAPGEAFQQQEWDAAKVGALTRLARGRYAAAKIVESEARVDPESASADLRLRLDSGPVFHAAGTEVAGLKRYPARIVSNLNPFARGEPYDGLKLDLYQRRLLETGYFNAVQFTIDPDPDQSSAAPLHVNVIEAASQRIDTGVLYSTDVGPGLTFDYGNVDIFDSAWRFRAVTKLNAKEQTGEITFDTPPRGGGVWNTFRGALNRTDIQNQISREGVVGAAYNWGLQSVPSQVSVSAHYETLTIAGAGSETNHAVFAGYRRTFRTTEDLVSPRRGLIGTIETGGGIPGLSSREFGRIRGHVNWLIPAGARNDFLVRAEAGWVIAAERSGIPSSFLFRTGGDQTIRGYAYQAIGVAQGEAIVGGRYLALGSVEYTRWISDTLGAAVFVDAGDAFDEPKDFEIAAGYGLGVRWRSPVGPFRADLAYGQLTHKVRLHFSVGYAF
jgi:translocation and assembly module TamA